MSFNMTFGVDSNKPSKQWPLGAFLEKMANFAIQSIDEALDVWTFTKVSDLDALWTSIGHHKTSVYLDQLNIKRANKLNIQKILAESTKDFLFVIQEKR